MSSPAHGMSRASCGPRYWDVNEAFARELGLPGPGLATAEQRT
jgi:hypothetical protein